MTTSCERVGRLYGCWDRSRHTNDTLLFPTTVSSRNRILNIIVIIIRIVNSFHLLALRLVKRSWARFTLDRFAYYNNATRSYVSQLIILTSIRQPTVFVSYLLIYKSRRTLMTTTTTTIIIRIRIRIYAFLVTV